MNFELMNVIFTHTSSYKDILVSDGFKSVVNFSSTNKSSRRLCELICRNLILFDFRFIESPQQFNCESWIHLYRSIFAFGIKNFILGNLTLVPADCFSKITIEFMTFEIKVKTFEILYNDVKLYEYDIKNQKVQDFVKFLQLDRFIQPENDYFHFLQNMTDMTNMYFLDQSDILKSPIHEIDQIFISCVNILKNLCVLYKKEKSMVSVNELVENKKFEFRNKKFRFEF